MGLWLKQDDGTLAEVSGGVNGEDGQPGIDGLPGADGNMWHVGSGDPASTLGSPGDYYLDGEAGWVWVKRTDTSWTNLYVNLTGPPGAGGDGGGSHDHDYLPLSGGTLTGDLQVDGQLIVPSRKAIRTGSPTSVPDDKDYGLAVGNAGSNRGALAVSADNTATRYPIELWNPNGIVGRIVTVNSTTRYEVDGNRTPVSLASATDIPDALGTLEALRFRRFTDDDGVDAATAHKVYPFAVSAGMDPENPDYGVDYGRFTPLLGKALLELTAEVKELRQRIEELEK